MKLKGPQYKPIMTEVTDSVIRIKAEPRVDNSDDKVQLLIDKIRSLRNGEVILRAIYFAKDKHEGQCRKASSSLPYIIHPLSVAITLINHKCSNEVVAASILHDTLEDTNTTYEEIEKIFGKKIADLVLGVTELDKTHSWEERKGAYIEHLKGAPLEVLFISCADKLDNIKSLRKELSNPKIGVKVWESYNSPPDRQKYFFESLVNIFESRENEDPAGNFKLLSDRFKAEVRRVFGILV